MSTSNKKVIEKIEINDLCIELIRSKRKTLSLVIISKHNWLKQRIIERPAPVEKTALVNDAKVLFANTQITLNIQENQRGNAHIDDGILTLPVIKSSRPLADTIKSKLINWYKKQALNQIEQRIAHFAPIMNVNRPRNDKLRIREYKRRWGSCDHKGGLSFNWRIIMAPPEALDYVVIHELAHCHEFNHSKRFWTLVSEQMPDWKKQHDWLQINGGLLYQF